MNRIMKAERGVRAMYEIKLVVNNKTGLHARPASDLAALCTGYESDIQIVCGNEKINAKSIISILTAGIYSGSEIVLRIEGKDEQEAGDAVSNLIRNLKD